MSNRHKSLRFVIYCAAYGNERLFSLVSSIFQNPCDDKRHMEIWSRNKDCRRLPDFLVIGPQKTGTTALYRFLQLHPAIESNFNSDTTFEELQFFSNSDFYAQGNLLKSIDN